MAPDATPGNRKPSHHVTLEEVSGANKYGLILTSADGKANPRAIKRDPIQRTTLKLSQGSTRYSDFAEPFAPIDQNDWSGGRGLEDFERDQTRFFDSYRLNTWQPNRIIMGPQEVYSSGVRSLNQSLPGSVTWQALTGSQRFVAVKFTTPSGGYSAGRFMVLLRYVGAPSSLSLGLRNDSAGDPTGSSIFGEVTSFGAFIKQGEATHPKISIFWEFGEPLGPYTLASATPYWIRLDAGAGDNAANHWEVGVKSSAGTSEQSSDGTTWAAASFDLYFRALDVENQRETLPFEYKRGLYLVTKPDDNSAGRLYLNGDRGAADSNAGQLDRLIDATKSWTTNQYQAKIVLLTGGPGSEEAQPWREIASNTATALLVTGFNWKITHTTATEYVILGSDEWIEITGTGLTKPVTDVLVSQDVIYFAQGDATNIRRANFANVAGTWTAAYADDGTNKALFLKLVNDFVDSLQVWKANNDTVSVARASAVLWGAGATNLTFGTAIGVGSRDERISGLERYGAPEVLFVMKEGSVWAVPNDVPEQMPLRETETVRSEKNGHAHLVHGVYLYFSLLHSLERFFRNNLDDKGPSRDAGLPRYRQGPISALTGYPGIFFAAIDGGQRYDAIGVNRGNYSSILVYNQVGWHELYRPHWFGRRIRNLFFQVIPGPVADRLWFSEGRDVAQIPFPSDTLDHFRDPNSRYTHEGQLTTSWIYAGLEDVSKLYRSLKTVAEALTSTGQVIEADYQLDGAIESDAWTSISGDFNTVPVEELNLSANDDITGRRLRFRLVFYTDDSSKSPKLKATVLETLPRIATKYRYTLTFALSDNGQDLNGAGENYDRVETPIAQLDTWANTPTVLVMRCGFSPYDNKRVLVDPTSLQPFALLPGDVEKHVGSIRVEEI
ncbi:MAG: hypothetical protein ACRDHG_13645 [Anaerolineales bacterium]